MATDTKMELSVWEKFTDSLSSFSEGIASFIGRMFGSSNDRIVKSLGYYRARAGDEHTVLPNSLLAQVNAWEDDMRAKTDEELKGMTAAFRERLAAGETLDDLLPEAFAACREAARRTKNMRHFDVQIVGGIILHRGMIAEMVTGEGKTLVATLPAFLNALVGKGVHIITVNDYLARRDCEWMSPIYHALGLTCGYIQSDMEQTMGPEARRKAYDCDITYGTNSEFGFDYLRDNMKPARWGDPAYPPHAQQAQRALHYAIIDEVDNILIDEARTPLIISGESQDDPKLYDKANQIALELTRLEKKAQEKLRSVGHGVNIPDHPLMQDQEEDTDETIQDKAVTHGTKTPETTLRDAANDEEIDQIDVNNLQTAEMEAKQEKRLGYYFEVKEKERSCHLTDEGIRKAEELAGVESFYTAGNMEWPHLIDNALKAHHLYHKDKNYVVMRNPEPPNEMAVIIVDEFTGRLMLGRQWSDGLHQAVEAKHAREGVKIKKETQTLATVTLQNFFRLYDKLAGMTGTAMTEANEFWKIYKREVVAIPTNKPLSRINFPDMIYLTEKEKWDAVVDEIERVHRYDIVTLKDGTELVGVIKTENDESLEIELKDAREKRTLTADEIEDIERHGRPVLVGTTDVKKSEKLSALLKRRGIKHELLNAKPEYADREAEIVAQAGRVGAVTLSTNMAGRGTDIILGGNAEYLAWARLKSQYATRLDVPGDVWKATVDEIRSKENMEEEGREIAEMGGLHVIGTERHESRRIDNQLRGRAGRQGDPGSGRFFVSLQDDLMRIFAGEWVANVLTKLGMEPGQAIESTMVSRRIEAAQKKVEEHNFDIRKNLLEYDEVMDYQRRRVYGYRQEILEGANCRARVWSMIEQQIDTALDRYLAPNYGLASFAELVQQQLSIECEAEEFKDARFEEAERIAKSRAESMVPTQIQEAMDENLDDEVDPREWNWQAMADRVNRLWGLNMTAAQLKKIGRDNVAEQIMTMAAAKIAAVDLDKGKLYLLPDWGLRSLCSWFELKFQISLDPSKFNAEMPRAAIRQILIDQVSALYRQKEIEFPVKVAMARFMADHGGAMGQRYNREGLYHWYLTRFGPDAGITEEEFRTESRPRLQEKLLALSAKTLPAGGHEEIDQTLRDALAGTRTAEEGDAQEIAEWAKAQFNLDVPTESLVGATYAEARDVLCNAFDDRYRPEMKRMERSLLLNQVDMAWKAHLLAIDHLRQGIGLVSYAQIDPKSEFKRIGMKEFDSMWEGLGNKTTDIVFRIEDDEAFAETVWSISETRHESAPQLTAPPPGSTQSQQQAIQSTQTSEKRTEPIRNFDKKVGRNEPCPCGSGKKYKNCHMRTAAK